MPACFLTYATTKFEAEISDIEIFHVFHDCETQTGMVKPHVNKSIQYMKLIGNQSIFLMVWFVFILVLYIYTSLTIHDGTLC